MGTWPWRVSGAECAGVPVTIPLAVRFAPPSNRAMPKSASTGSPNEETRMFSGFTSRCSTRARCADSSAPAIFTPMSATSAQGSGPRVFRRSASEPAGLVAHDQVRQAIAGLTSAVDGDDVRVLGQGTHGLQLLFEAAAETFVDPGDGDDLDRHLPGERRLAALEDDGHATPTDFLEVLDPGDLHRHYRGANAR